MAAAWPRHIHEKRGRSRPILLPHAQGLGAEIGYLNGQYHASVDRAQELQPSGVGACARDLDNNWAVADGSTIYPTQIFPRGIRMVEEFGFGASYLEFGAFLYQNGHRGRCVPGAAVEHYAEVETLRRGESVGAMESRLFASLCYNLYFRRSLLLALRYSLTLICLHGRTFRLMSRLHAIFVSARNRWTSLGAGGGSRSESPSS